RTHRAMGPGAGPVACRTDAYGRRARSGAARTRAGSPHRGRMVGCASMPGQTHDRDHVRPISAERIDACAAIVRKPSYMPPDDPAMVLIDRYYGHKEAAVLFGMTVNTANVRNVASKMIDNWGRLV